VTDPELKSRYWLVRKAVCLIGYYGGLRTNELRNLEFNKTFAGGEKSFETDSNGIWLTFERSKQRGKVETTTIVVPRRTVDWIPVAGDSFRSPVDYDPASIIDEYLEVISMDFGNSQEELSGPFFRSTHGVNGHKFSAAPLGVNTLGKVPIEFAMQLVLPNATSYTGHCWRRSCGTNASNAGVNVTTLMAQMGWTTPKTALGYVSKSKITSFKMSLFLSNIQRTNKYLDEAGVRSSRKGVQLQKSEVIPRSATKKLNPPLSGLNVGRVGGLQGSQSGNSLAFHLIGEGVSKTDSGVRDVMSSLENHEEMVAAREGLLERPTVASSFPQNLVSNSNCVSESVISESSSSAVASSLPTSAVASSLPTSADASSLSSFSSSASSLSSSASASSLASSSVTNGGVDPRIAAILQNFQNNGSVQIHLHFHGTN
jgi:hypothetical protein